jgi:glycosyltransferase involved in cell wall biosynthesis
MSQGNAVAQACRNCMRISIITVVFNNAPHISDAIKSVLTQDYPFIEYVIIDGGSTDGTLDVIEKYREQISIFLSEKDQGIYDAFNKGIRLASGEVVGFLHSDDLFAHRGVITSIAQRLNSKNADVVYGDLDYIHAYEVNRVVRHWRAGPFTLGRLRFGWMPPHPTVYARREIYECLGDFDLSYRIAADYDYMLRMFSNEDLRIDYLPEILVKMRLGGASNRNLSNIVRKSIEDYRALKNNHVGGLPALLWKNFRKLPQFFLRD